MMTADKVTALKLVIQAYRYSTEPEPVWAGMVGALIMRFENILANAPERLLEASAIVASVHDDQGGVNDNSKSTSMAKRSRRNAFRMGLASLLTDRPIRSFKELLGGELKAMLEEPDFDEIILYLLEQGVLHG